jgi:hypothetical protein
LLIVLVPAGARAQLPDSDFVRVELGGSSDVTNERFYEDAFDDTTFTGRRLTGSPEYRTAGVAAFHAAGAFPRGGRYLLLQEATAGDHLLRSYTRLDLRGEPRDGWRLSLAPELDARRDRSFGGDRSELRFRPEGRVRATSLDRASAWDLLVGGDWLRTSGSSEVIALDRNAGRAWLRWTHTPLASPWETELGYGADARAFPDSVNRDHVEQHGALTLRRRLPGSGSATLDTQLDRRRTLYETPSTRDHFWSGRADANAFVHLHDALTAELWVSVEGYRYDHADTTAYFDYQCWTVRPSFRWSLAHDWGLRIGPRLEWLGAPQVPAERYHEVAGVIEAERLHGGDWWSFTPAAGWRQYERSAATVSLAEPDLHSSYLFLEAELFGDVGLPNAIRARFSGSGRFEQHEDPSQNAASLYCSLDLRRSF